MPGHPGRRERPHGDGRCTSALSGAVLEYRRKTSRISDLGALMGRSPIADLPQRLSDKLVCPSYLPGTLLTAHDALRGILQNFCPRP